MTELRPTAELLNLAFGLDPPIGEELLAWYYLDNPEGRASVGRTDDGNRQIGNYSLVPIRFSSQTGDDLRLGLGVHLATHPDARGTGTFRQTVEDSYRVGTADGLHGILGVANALSAPRMADAMGWRLLPHFDARFLIPIGRPASMAVHPVDQNLLAGPVPSELLPTATPPPPSGHGTRWTADLLRWRLARPGSCYVLHVGDEVALVSTTVRRGPLRVAVLLKVLPRTGPGHDSAAMGAIDTGTAAATVARHHRTPFVLHWGITPHLIGGGIRLPRPLMPSPLALVVHSFEGGAHDEGRPRFAREDLAITCFEFLDFDAY